jgi:glycosyltransferase involved in cell wall biosynthesis
MTNPVDGSFGTGSILIAHPSAELYGSDRVMLETVEALTSRGRQVVVTLPAEGPLVAAIADRGGRTEICPSPVLRKSALRPRGALALVAETARSLPQSLRLIRRVDPEAVVVNTITIPLWLVAAKIARRRVICHVHEAESKQHKIVQRALALPLLLADELILNSKFSQNVLTAAFARLGRNTTIVYNAVPGPSSVVLARPELTGPCRMLFIGRLSPRKGPQIALAALKTLRDRGIAAHLSLLGAVFPGYEWFEQELRASAAADGLEDQVTFLGFQPDVWPHLAQADVVLVPSVADEPFGNTAVEAVLAARPLVVSATSGLLEAAAGYRSAQSVQPDEPTALADAVVNVVGGWNEYRINAMTDRALAHERHEPERYRKQVAEIVLASAHISS